mmetsp:Transcript_75232/g.178764  ORF Transcript_75232/g.178764 Transcript_75232/m.178764 type:complete len:225 (-) Transcript_75232:130-804(-)
MCIVSRFGFHTLVSGSLIIATQAYHIGEYDINAGYCPANQVEETCSQCPSKECETCFKLTDDDPRVGKVCDQRTFSDECVSTGKSNRRTQFCERRTTTTTTGTASAEAEDAEVHRSPGTNPLVWMVLALLLAVVLAACAMTGFSDNGHEARRLAEERLRQGESCVDLPAAYEAPPDTLPPADSLPLAVPELSSARFHGGQQPLTSQDFGLAPPREVELAAMSRS